MDEPMVLVPIKGEGETEKAGVREQLQLALEIVAMQERLAKHLLRRLQQTERHLIAEAEVAHGV